MCEELYLVDIVGYEIGIFLDVLIGLEGVDNFLC